jgi:hypothetical protein
MTRNYINTQTALTTTGSSAYIYIGSLGLKEACYRVAIVNASSAVVKVEYSIDGSGAGDYVGTSYTLTSGDETVVLSVNTQVAEFVRLTLVSGTVTSVTPTLIGTIGN